jgi:cytochrome P450
MNRKFNNAIKVVERVSKKLIEEKKYNESENGEDLLSLLIKINKTLPIEEKMTDDELKYQVIKKKQKLYCHSHLFNM